MSSQQSNFTDFLSKDQKHVEYFKKSLENGDKVTNIYEDDHLLTSFKDRIQPLKTACIDPNLFNMEDIVRLGQLIYQVD